MTKLLILTNKGIEKWVEAIIEEETDTIKVRSEGINEMYGVTDGYIEFVYSIMKLTGQIKEEED